MIVTHHVEPLDTLETMRKTIKRRHDKDKDCTWQCPDVAWVCYGIVDGLVDYLMPLVKELRNQVASVEKQIFKDPASIDQDELLRSIQNSRAFLTDIRYALMPKHSIVSNIMANCHAVPWMDDVPLPWWTDAQDHLSKMANELDVSNTDLENLQNVFLAKISLDITKRSHNLNEVASKVGFFTTIFLPLTFLTG